MPLKPPKGRGPAVAHRPIPGSVITAAIAAAVVAFIALLLLDVSGAMDSLGPVKYGLIGLVGAGLALGPKYYSYAAGQDWIKRGDAWVATSELTSARVDGQVLRLRDASSRKVRLPLAVLANTEPLLAALTSGARASYARGGMEADGQARELFALPADTAT